MPEDIIILQQCDKNYDHMIIGYRVMARRNTHIFVLLLT